VIDDLIQETYLKLCASGLRSFKAIRADRPDAIFAYVRVFTANLVHDQLKAAKAQKRGGSVDTSSEHGEIAATGRVMTTRTESVIERRLLLQEVESCLTAVAPGAKSERDRRIFWLYYRVGLSANAIANLPTIDLTTKGVESTILRLTRLVRKQLGEPRQRGTTNIGPTKGMSTENSF
jgi:RNA polymerase sigma-70 factor (ECF subfamily)